MTLPLMYAWISKYNFLSCLTKNNYMMAHVYLERINFLDRLTNTGDDKENEKTMMIKECIRRLNNQLQQLGLFTAVTDYVTLKIKQLS